LPAIGLRPCVAFTVTSIRAYHSFPTNEDSRNSN
jgi:hypothetical protein